MTTTIIGIDPGKSGGIAVLCNGIADVTAMPATVHDIISTLLNWDEPVVWVEDVHAMPGNGSIALFKLGRNVGQLEGALAALNLRYRFISPSKWQKEFGLQRTKKTETTTQKKNRHKAEAQRLFPSVRVTHAVADALLIAEYGRRQA